MSDESETYRVMEVVDEVVVEDGELCDGEEETEDEGRDVQHHPGPSARRHSAHRVLVPVSAALSPLHAPRSTTATHNRRRGCNRTDTSTSLRGTRPQLAVERGKQAMRWNDEASRVLSPMNHQPGVMLERTVESMVFPSVLIER